MWSEVTGNKLTEKYIDIGNYSIWKQKFLNNLCSKDESLWCLNAELLWTRITDNNEAYVYFNLNYSTVTGIDSKEIGGYFFNLYKKSESQFVKDIKLIPEYWYVHWSVLDLYTKVDLDKLDANKKEIFKELERNPSVIINGINHTN